MKTGWGLGTNEARNLKLLVPYSVPFLNRYTVPTKKVCQTQQTLFSWDQGEEDRTRRGSREGSGWNHTTEREEVLPTVSCSTHYWPTSHQWSVQSRQCQRKHWSSYLLDQWQLNNETGNWLPTQLSHGPLPSEALTFQQLLSFGSSWVIPHVLVCGKLSS